MAITAITVNGSESSNVFPAIILGSAAAATGDDVTIFFTPSGAPTMVKGALEKIEGKEMPDIVELFEGTRVLGGKFMVCELALKAKNIKVEDFREGVEIVGATTFLSSIADASITFSF